MSASRDPSMHERLERLEHQVAELQEEVEALKRDQASSSDEAAPTSHHPDERPTLADRVAPHLSWESENWLNRIGIALLLFGLAFLFKFTIDQGWITPSIRVSFGVLLGLTLLGIGLRLRPKRPALGQVLEGGGIAVGYVTAFAAYQLYALVAYPVAFVAMVAVTAAAFVLAVRQQDRVLSLIGVLGGLGTPFLLYTDAGSIPGLVGYTSLILAGAVALAWFECWRVVLGTAVAATWVVLVFTYVNLTMAEVQTLADRAALQGGVLLTWAAGSLVPLVRLGRPRTRDLSGQTLLDVAHPLPLVMLVTPLLALVFTGELWTPWAPWSWDLLLLGASATYAGLYTFFREGRDPRLAATLGLTTLILAGWLAAAVTDGAYTYALLALEAVAALALTRRFPDRVLRHAGHALAGLATALLVVRFVDVGSGTPPFWHPPVWAELTVIAACAAALRLTGGRVRLVYALATHVLLLAWLYRFFAPLPEGQAFVSVAWAAYAVALLVAGFVRDAYLLRTTALLTIVLLVAKLFILDLAQLAAVWRILLFLGLGVFFLLLSYYLPGFFGTREDQAG